ncbi:amidohydrolase [Isoptericola sp. NPDC057391]|uniref:amidohydrolase family protein n=1 Tax=Isoptericola sp. NPDC057391 TaxID=3346117 RepID=UPI0036257BF5
MTAALRVPPGVAPVELPGDVSPEVRRRLQESGTVLPPFTDAHVHLGLVDPAPLRARGVAAVHDLGWEPQEVAALAAEPGLPRVAYAGAFLTAPGGYPSDRDWAPPGAVETVADPASAVAAVDRQVSAGASFVKVALHVGAGPTPDEATLAAVVGHAHDRGRPVVAHAEGAGQAARAFEAGVDRLAHAPFSERLDDDLLTAMAGGGATRRPMTWLSTLDIHGWGDPTPEHEVALDNVRRFVAAGGRVRYGTDLGNGPLPVGLNARELAALADSGLGRRSLLVALVGDEPPAGLVSFVPGPAPAPTDPGAVHAAWLARATVLDVDDLRDPGFVPPAAPDDPDHAPDHAPGDAA